MKKSVCSGVVLATLVASSIAFAQESDETWLVTGSGSGAAPVSDLHDDAYDIGVTGGLGLYRSLVPQLQLGARIDGGALPSDEATSPAGELGLGALNAALRVRPFGQNRDVERGTGFYLEAAGGPGLLEDELRPFLAPGAGYIFAVGDVGIGPTARYIHVLEPDEGSTLENDVQVATVGIEVVLFDERGPSREMRQLEQPVPAPSERFEPASRFERRDSDGDGLDDDQDSCELEPETVNGIDDHDGCPDSGKLGARGRFVIDERTFFDYDSAVLRASGRAKLDEIVAQYRSGGENWSKLRVKGHADRRGPMPYNEELSRERAQVVRQYLVQSGLPAEVVDVEAYGETRPAVPNADTEREHQLNRRVEFEIVREASQ